MPNKVVVAFARTAYTPDTHIYIYQENEMVENITA
jgi:hypothetical protein